MYERTIVFEEAPARDLPVHRYRSSYRWSVAGLASLAAIGATLTTGVIAAVLP